MRKKIRRVVLLYTVLFCFSHFVFQQKVYAADGAGGQAVRTGKISFYENSTDKPTADTTASSDPTTSSLNEPPANTTAKPAGKLPNTGETMQKLGFWGVCLVLIFVCFLFLRKRRRRAHR